MKFKAKIFYNMVEELDIEAETEKEARDKAYAMSGEGETSIHFDFIEIEEVV